MLIRFFEHLRAHRVPVLVRELLDLEAALHARLVAFDIPRFYFLARLCLVKDERFFDRFDIAFGTFFGALDDWGDLFEEADPRQQLEALLDQLQPPGANAEWRAILDEYDATLLDKSASSDSEAQGYGDDEGEGDGDGDGDGGEQGEGEDGEEGEGEDGDKGEGEDGKEGEGTGGEEGLGANDEPAEGVRDDELDHAHQRRAAAVWQLREYADYDPDVELGTRTMKVALRRLRKFARESAELELDLDATISRTARQAGILDIVEVPERHNAVKVLLLLDVGGSMDEHIERCAQLFSAARTEFKYLEFYYFHNFIYEGVWTENARRAEDRIRTVDLFAKFGPDVKVIIVGDASMGRHEIAEQGGSVEHYNAEAGEVWLARLRDRFRHVVWLNPVPVREWQNVYTIEMVRRLMEGRMYHLGMDGLEQAMKSLVR